MKLLSENIDSFGIPMNEEEIFTDQSGKYWGDSGAGGVFYALSTGRFLLAHRSSEVNEPDTWGVWGGSIEKGESPEKALKREIKEEAGFEGSYQLKHLYTYQDQNFKFYNYIIIIKKEFEPKHSWETQGHLWCTIDQFPSPLHFGLKKIIPYLKKFEEQQ